MKLSFKPMPGLTIVTVISLAILIALGTWQYQRLQWKTALLAEIDQVADAPPFTSFPAVQAALAAGEPIDFRRIGIAGQHEGSGTVFHVFTAMNRDVSWRVFSPVVEGGVTAFAAQGVVKDGEAKSAATAPARGDAQVNGYVRLAREDASRTKHTPENNRWFAFNPMPKNHNWADQIAGDVEVRFYVDAVMGAEEAKLLPPKRPDIRNNHFDYMLTWYGLAIVLLVIYLIMHRRAGRLSWS